MPVAYRLPLDADMQAEVDQLDLRQMGQLEVACPLGCGKRYVLIYDPNENDQQALDYYRQALEGHMHGCNEHPRKIVVNF